MVVIMITHLQFDCLGQHRPTPPYVLRGRQGPEDDDHEVSDYDFDDKNMMRIWWEHDDHLGLVIIEHDKFGARVARFGGVRARHRGEAENGRGHIWLSIKNYQLKMGGVIYDHQLTIINDNSNIIQGTGERLIIWLVCSWWPWLWWSWIRKRLAIDGTYGCLVRDYWAPIRPSY